MAEWTRCVDRLPESDGWYLVTIYFAAGSIVRTDKLFTMHGHRVWLAYMSNQVTAWQELPEPFDRKG